MLESQAAKLGFGAWGRMESAQIHACEGCDSPGPGKGLLAQGFPRSAQREPRVLWLGHRATVPKEEGRVLGGPDSRIIVLTSVTQLCLLRVYGLDFF